jgi:hypothetical protein
MFGIAGKGDAYVISWPNRQALEAGVRGQMHVSKGSCCFSMHSIEAF